MREFGRQIAAVPTRYGRVLDIGCGADVPHAVRMFAGPIGPLDGVDPDPIVVTHPALVHRWQTAFEAAPIPEQAYGLVYAYNVLEHIAEPRRFFEKVASVLQPGGVFLALAPNARHPFAWISRAAEVLGLKSAAGRVLGGRAASPMNVNAYPSYYRANSPAAIQRAIEGLGLSATFTFVPCVQWEMYFPRWLRWMPHLWDRIVTARAWTMNQVLIVKVVRRANL